MRFAWFGASALVILVAAGCGSSKTSSSESTQASRQAIQGGTLDTTDTFAVGVCGDFGQQGGQCAGRCSGALLTPNLVVTARHCVSQSPELIDCTANPSFGGGNAQSWHITTNSSMGGAAGKHAVKSIRVPSDDHICGNDIALLILNDLVPASEATPITPSTQYTVGDYSRFSRTFTAIGYGITSPGSNDSGTRRRLDGVQLYCVPGDVYTPCPAEINENEFVGGDGTCSGDSGSSAYETNSYNKKLPISWGVLSRGGQSDDGTKCVGSLYTRLDKWRDLIIDAAKEASANWTLYNEPDWTGPVYPVPPKPGKSSSSSGTSGESSSGETSSGAPAGKADGESCYTPAECQSGTCFNSVCTTSCTDDSQCTGGFTCRDSYCQAPSDSSQANGGETTTTSGCSVSGDPATGASARWMGLFGLAVAVAAVRRRTSA